MYLFLLVFGVLLTVAGIVLGSSGVSVHDRAVDASLITPAVIASAGGLILIGLGFGLRVLQRIELALAARPMPRASRAGELAVPAVVAPAQARIPLPLKTEIRAPAIAEEAGEANPPEFSRVKFPTLARAERGSLAEEMEAAVQVKVPARAESEIADTANAPVARRGNGTARLGPRLDMTARSATTTARPQGPAFDALWPTGPRSSRPAHAVPPPAPIEPEPQAPAAPVQDEALETVSILKSGVVDGMAYTLYSDGSIEAQLPQGTVKFGSITELRTHIEQTTEAGSSA